MTTRSLDECLSIRDGELFIGEHQATALVARFGSPLFVVSEDQLRRNVRRFQRAFERGWPDGTVRVLPAAKASWSTAVQRILALEGCGCDVYSPGELAVALKVGFEPSAISVNGVPKDPDQIERAVRAGVRITIDSFEEVEIIERAARDSGKRAGVRLRLKPTLVDFTDHSQFVSEGLVPTDLAAMVYKGGLTFEHIQALAPRLRASNELTLVGFHQHHGRHQPTTRYWEEQMRAYAREMGRVRALLGGFTLREIDIGGGFATPRDPFNAATNYRDPLELGALYTVTKALRALGERRYPLLAKIADGIVGKANDKPAPSIEDYAATATRVLRDELARQGIDTRGVVLQLEPGRSLHGNTGVHLTTVRAVKRMTTPIRWNIAVVDTTEFWLTGGRYEHHLHHHLLANKADAAHSERTDINGRSCYGDRILPAVRLPPVAVGDVLALLDTGAYQEVSASNFNALPRPATVLVAGDRAHVIRRAETEEDVFRRDSLPEWLDNAAAESTPTRLMTM
jgi:diaminopimelate decarboxylase